MGDPLIDALKRTGLLLEAFEYARVEASRRGEYDKAQTFGIMRNQIFGERAQR